MVKHVILWELKSEFSAEEKAEIKKSIKTGLESLAGVIPGLVDIKVNIDGLGSSNADCMLDSTFVDEAALKAYAIHPAHQDVANTKVRPYTSKRMCLDFEV
ncbi:MAG: Dabb family protein [Lentisphaerae bacterium]|nr:Dabb family protein [Lentisphaerota bacterium]